MSTGGGSAIRIPSVRTIAIALGAIGAIFGTAEVSVIAYSEALGDKGAASFVLAGYAGGSLLVGVVYGLLRLRMPLSRQLLVAVGIVMLTTIPPLLVDSVPALGLALFLAGAAISPTFIAAFGLIERLVPSASLTEGITWGMTGIGLGLAVGSIASGFVIDAFGAQSGFWISVVAGVVALATMVLGLRTLEVPADRWRQPGGAGLTNLTFDSRVFRARFNIPVPDQTPPVGAIALRLDAADSESPMGEAGLQALSVKHLQFAASDACSRAPQSRMLSNTGSSDRPSSVTSYSTLGGTSGNTVLFMIPSASSSRSCKVIIRGVAEGAARHSALKRNLPVSR